jgi:lipoate synthase
MIVIVPKHTYRIESKTCLMFGTSCFRHCRFGSVLKRFFSNERFKK